jgi:hypothetical protein
MNFVKKGDQEIGHYHGYDHGTLLASGKLLVEKLDENDKVNYTKEFVAPSFIFIEKDSRHVLTALEDNTVATCIHALRTIDDEIIDPDFLVEQKEFADTIEEITDEKPSIGKEFYDRGLIYKTLASHQKK